MIRFYLPLACLLAVIGCTHSDDCPDGEHFHLEDKEHFENGLGASVPESEPLRGVVLEASMDKTQSGYAGNGYSRLPGSYITWGGGASSPLDVIEATIRRLEHVQGTLSASNENAKALFALMQARDYLTGSQEVTATPESLGSPSSETEGTEE